MRSVVEHSEEWRTRMTAATAIAKRSIDAVAAVGGLLVLSPLMLVIAALIKADSPGPVFFRQERIGRYGRPFRIHKFRSMTVERPGAGSALTTADDRRITSVGRILRETKLDELPQLFNVLSGSMSLVGPRPEVAKYMGWYTPEERQVILSVRPGMTDLASILFRNESEMLDPSRGDPEAIYRDRIMPIKSRYYDHYCRNVSVWLDFKIIVSTILVLAVGRIPSWLMVDPVASGTLKRAL